MSNRGELPLIETCPSWSSSLASASFCFSNYFIPFACESRIVEVSWTCSSKGHYLMSCWAWRFPRRRSPEDIQNIYPADLLEWSGYQLVGLLCWGVIMYLTWPYEQSRWTNPYWNSPLLVFLSCACLNLFIKLLYFILSFIHNCYLYNPIQELLGVIIHCWH
jgi:hypothetical protein